MTLPGPDTDTWDRLAAQSRNIFQTRDFATAWWDAKRPGGDVRVLTDRPEDPRCIIPVYRSGSVVPMVRQIGHGPADALGPLCAPEDRGLAAEVMLSELGTELRRGVVVMHDAEIDDGWQERLGGELIRVSPGPAVRLGFADWDEFLRTRSKNFREQTRRKHRRLHRSFDVQIRTSTVETLEDDLATLRRLHQLRWGQGADFAVGEQADLVAAFSRRCLERDRLRLMTMELDGTPVASLLGLRFAGVHSFWQSGRDPEHEEHSVGSVLLMEAVRAAVEDGASEYRLLRGGEAYKRRLADLDRDTCTFAVAAGTAGRAMIGAARARRTVEHRVKSLRGTSLPAAASPARILAAMGRRTG